MTQTTSDVATKERPAPAAAPQPPLEAARALAPMIRAAADEIESIRELPRAVFEALADARLFQMALPRAIGGLEIDLPTYVQVIEEIGKADASTGWCLNQGTIFGMYAARMPSEIAKPIWIDTPRGVVSNSPAPTARAVVVPGGYRVTGRQGFSTGCRHASWVAAHSQVIENGEPRLKPDGKPEIRYLFVPISQVELLDTWHTRGMRGTGTHHFQVTDVFVPAERTVLQAGAALVHEGPLYKIPRTLGFACGDAAVALGVARSCLTEFYDLAGAKAPRYTTALLRDQLMVQSTVGKAEAAIRSGRAFLMESVRAIWEEATRGAVTLDARAAIRLSTTHAIRLAADVVDAVYNAAGATAAFQGNIIQRYFQDIHVITQHVQSRFSHYDLVGRHVLGLKVEEQHM